MIRYAETQVVFQEFPGETTLAINLTQCPHRCPGCHSPHLWKGANPPGEKLTTEVLFGLIQPVANAITCVGFMGGDNDIPGLMRLVRMVRKHFPSLKIGWYSGRSSWTDNLMEPFDYVKFGPWKQELGGLDRPGTNQRLFKRIRCVNRWIDITGWFQTRDEEYRNMVLNFESLLKTTTSLTAVMTKESAVPVPNMNQIFEDGKQKLEKLLQNPS